MIFNNYNHHHPVTSVTPTPLNSPSSSHQLIGWTPPSEKGNDEVVPMEVEEINWFEYELARAKLQKELGDFYY